MPVPLARPAFLPGKAIIVAANEMFIRGLCELGLEASLLGSLEKLPAQSLGFSFSSQGARHHAHCMYSTRAWKMSSTA